ncbi:hypothetical protein IQ247_07820 [Plectonema cf. radiosum LEGE 06105]|uniref:Uncharacterized protein n=1 Tax=Plectonema cf. radiosum LEGE 06105 TaxID=945769 RepID=A0A8J7JSJ6_9CYAN|nr:hypothetical protein [Plectonema radiosum]MBE9212624.1 hypothetical protein [Plectonema cf. radiosum LEGE 06105]
MVYFTDAAYGLYIPLNIRLASIDAKLIQFISEDLSIEEAEEVEKATK